MSIKQRLRKEHLKLSQLNAELSTKHKTWGELIERTDSLRILAAAASVLGRRGSGLQTSIEDFTGGELQLGVLSDNLSLPR